MKKTNTTLAVPARFKDHCSEATWALKLDKGNYLLPENATDLILDREAEISHDDILFVVFKKNPELYWLYKMVGQASPRADWWREHKGNAHAEIMFETKDGDGFMPFDLAEIERIDRVLCCRDSDNEYHSLVDHTSTQKEVCA